MGRSFRPLPSKEELRKAFDYDPVAGTLIRRSTGRPIVPGRPSNCISACGGKYMCHRMVWAWHNDDPCGLMVDHIDGDWRNNRIDNLRLATTSQNRANVKGAKGYSFARDKRSQKKPWVVRVRKGSGYYYGGCFVTEAEAQEAAKVLSIRIHGEFSPYYNATPAKPLRRTVEFHFLIETST